jgi:hypothetical protein
MIQRIRQVEHDRQDEFTAASDEPALLKGWALDWPASSKWSLDYFSREFGDEVVPLSNYQDAPHQKPAEKPQVSMRQYIEFIRSGQSTNAALDQDSYLAGWHFNRTVPHLMDDIIIPQCFRENILDQVTKPLFPYESTSFFIGHKEVESPLHTDSFGVSVWLANVIGTKSIRVVPPIDYVHIKNGMDVFSDEVVEFLESKKIPVMECQLDPGDIVFIPPGHWHHVKNHGMTMALSVNFVNRYHFLPFEQQLRSKVIVPFMKLIELKSKILRGSPDDGLSIASAQHFKVIENETLFLDFMEKKIGEERRRIGSLRMRGSGPAGN